MLCVVCSHAHSVRQDWSILAEVESQRAGRQCASHFDALMSALDVCEQKEHAAVGCRLERFQLMGVFAVPELV